MAAELISCAIKVLRFFPCNTDGLAKLIEPLTVSVSIPMLCESIDPRGLEIAQRETVSETYLTLSSRGTSGIVCPTARWGVPAPRGSSCRRTGGSGQTGCGAVCARRAPGRSPRRTRGGSDTLHCWRCKPRTETARTRWPQRCEPSHLLHWIQCDKKPALRSETEHQPPYMC